MDKASLLQGEIQEIPKGCPSWEVVFYSGNLSDSDNSAGWLLPVSRSSASLVRQKLMPVQRLPLLDNPLDAGVTLDDLVLGSRTTTTRG